MPFINTKATIQIDEQKQEALKAGFAGLVEECFGKNEKWLMVGFEPKTDLWFGGSKQEKAAFISVSLVGDPPSEIYETFSDRLCSLFEQELDIPGKNIYVVFQPVTHTDWGWNHQTF